MLQAMLDRKESLAVDRWVDDQLFEEDVRSVLLMMRPHRRERLMGWKEYRTGGSNFRVTISWNNEFEEMESSRQQPRLVGDVPPPRPLPQLSVPNMSDVIESLLVGSARDQDEITPQEEFGHYRAVVAELARRIDEMEACYT
jgi:hypothetical protein